MSADQHPHLIVPHDVVEDLGRLRKALAREPYVENWGPRQRHEMQVLLAEVRVLLARLEDREDDKAEADLDWARAVIERHRKICDILDGPAGPERDALAAEMNHLCMAYGASWVEVEWQLASAQVYGQMTEDPS